MSRRLLPLGELAGGDEDALQPTDDAAADGSLLPKGHLSQSGEPQGGALPGCRRKAWAQRSVALLVAALCLAGIWARQCRGEGAPLARTPHALGFNSVEDGGKKAPAHRKLWPSYCANGGRSGPSFNQSLRFAGAELPRSELTIVVRARTSAKGNYQDIISWATGDSHAGCVELRLDPRGNLEYSEFRLSQQLVQATPEVDLADGDWHHIAVIRKKDGLVQLFANGGPIGAGSIEAELPSGMATTARSARLQALSEDLVFQGDVSGLQVFGEALSHDELASLAEPDCSEGEGGAGVEAAERTLLLGPTPGIPAVPKRPASGIFSCAVTHSEVYVRGAPSADAVPTAQLTAGQHVRGRRTGQWLLLDAGSAKKLHGISVGYAEEHSEHIRGPAWVMVDERELGQGVARCSLEGGSSDDAGAAEAAADASAAGGSSTQETTATTTVTVEAQDTALHDLWASIMQKKGGKASTHRRGDAPADTNEGEEATTSNDVERSARTQPAPEEKEEKESHCRDAQRGERCHDSVSWAMTHEIHEHPEWYPGLSPSSDFSEFQAVLHSVYKKCPQPCKASAVLKEDEVRNILAQLAGSDAGSPSKNGVQSDHVATPEIAGPGNHAAKMEDQPSSAKSSEASDRHAASAVYAGLGAHEQGGGRVARADDGEPAKKRMASKEDPGLGTHSAHGKRSAHDNTQNIADDQNQAASAVFAGLGPQSRHSGQTTHAAAHADAFEAGQQEGLDSPLMTFYMYRAQSDQEYDLETINTASLAGVLTYLHNEVAGQWTDQCERHYNISRILRLKVTMKTPARIYNSAPFHPNFLPFAAVDRCHLGKQWVRLYDEWGYAPGCQHATCGKAGEYNYGPNSTWYSMPGPCPSQDCWKKTPECLQREPGGRCPHPDGGADCTWHVEPAGEIRLDDLVGLGDGRKFCKAGNKEYDFHTDRGVGTAFWDNRRSEQRCQGRIAAVQKMFSDKYPELPVHLDEPVCASAPVVMH